MKVNYSISVILLCFGLVAFSGCSSLSEGTNGNSTGTSPTNSPTTATAVIDPTNAAKLLLLTHEKGPQDVTYTYTSTVKTGQGTAQGSGKAIFTRSPQRFLLDIQFPSMPSLSRHQIYDYDTKKITSTLNGQTISTTSTIEPYYAMHNPAYTGKDSVNGSDAYHVRGTLYQNTLGIATEIWIRTADLYVVKVTQHVEESNTAMTWLILIPSSIRGQQFLLPKLVDLEAFFQHKKI